MVEGGEIMAAIGCSLPLEKSDVVGRRGRTVVVFGWFEEGSRRVRGFEGARIPATGLQRKRASTPKHHGSGMGWKTEAALALTLHYCQHEIRDRQAGGEYEGSAASCMDDLWRVCTSRLSTRV